MHDALILDLFADLALAAGKETLKHFRDETLAVEHKSDASPVTVADRAAEAIILDGLKDHLPDIPVIAEEEAAAGRIPNIDGERFILIDPLDGTREFVEGRSEYTINIALIEHGIPVIGAVFVPCQRVLYTGLRDHAEKIVYDKDWQVESRVPLKVVEPGERLRIVASRSHSTPKTEEFIARHKQADLVSVGSSIKFCLIASGEADLYPRFGPTMQWDTAAGDAVLRAAGGVTEREDGSVVRYGKREDCDKGGFSCTHFIASSGHGRS
ncbi:3'(2'),5'-bisphosphate nucleotidase CysQ [Limoniibacter endophyticus]|uniref:3'(2'),5'-bisphosphate nucleotidase CysQ n=1 Tax=Limoniibacter endophyticus TaxID=1565040 RepID=A0A8J3DIC4_9HYPH|nr:3'(2'),5'-bisphosphate nucleotidase CysQ [Limoniibacter endophyticus]GHC69787.1 3'(2'),5'-bisphosphate nucleotidase CysQ [Limoniibacter endophyticus]